MKARLPMLACVPHGGMEYPSALTGELAVSLSHLWSDWHTTELYDFLPGLGITTIMNQYSRFVADPNRDPAGDQHGSFWSSVVADRTPNGRALYRRKLTPDEIRYRVRLAHEPFHHAVDAAIGDLLPEFPKILLLDLHSFGVPLDADVILGDRRGRTATPEAMRLVGEAFEREGLRVAYNERFTGGWTVRRFALDDRVDAIQVELNQRRYLNFDGHRYPGSPPRGAFAETQRVLSSALAQIAAQYDS